MGSDLLALSALAGELNSILAGARVDKIVQPETDELRFFLRVQGKNLCLVMSCNAGAPRIHLTETKKQNPQTAPALCMLLRKYLAVSSIEDISVFNADRIIRIKFNARTEMRDNAVYYIFIEIMNRYSNIIFTDENLIILDAVKHLPLDAARDHVVLRGVRYEPVAQPKRSFLEDCSDIIDAFRGSDAHKYILDNISGFSGVTVSELLLRAGIGRAESVTDKDKASLKAVLGEFAEIRKRDYFSPCIFNGKEIYPFRYSVLDGDYKFFTTMSQAYDDFFSVCDSELRNKARLKALSVSVKRLRARVEKNIADDQEKLAQCENMEEFRIKGELIVSNIYKLKRGDKTLNCLNYYNGEPVEIKLDERLSPSANSGAYYAKYNKLKRTKHFVSKKLIQDKNLLDYIGSVEEELQNLPFDASAAPIEEELAALGLSKQKQNKKKTRREKPEPPYTYCIDGFTVLKGKNNLQNDELTFRVASSSDVWLHLKNRHGAHVIILSEGKEVPQNVLLTAAEIAAGSKGPKTDVDYTRRRFVKRLPGGHAGQVVYTDYKTLSVKPDHHPELLV